MTKIIKCRYKKILNTKNAYFFIRIIFHKLLLINFLVETID